MPISTKRAILYGWRDVPNDPSQRKSYKKIVTELYENQTHVYSYWP